LRESVNVERKTIKREERQKKREKRSKVSTEERLSSLKMVALVNNNV
jgi:hypothetical protein